MQILVLRSSKNNNTIGPFTVRMDVQFADRVLANLTDAPGYCTACADRCVACRKQYALDFSEKIAGIISFPAVLPVLCEEPEAWLPENIPPHDIVLAIAVNEEILISFIQTRMTAQGIIIPREGSDWLSPYAMDKIETLCSKRNIAVAFPKPFCSFAPGEGIFAEFVQQFRIGKPVVDFTIENDTIIEAIVRTSAPCGATYFTAQGCIGKKVAVDLRYYIDKQLSCFPCTADTAVDKDFHDSIMHQAVQIQRDILVWRG